MKSEQILVGETIKSAKIVGHNKSCDSENLLVLEMESGKIIYIEGGYGAYSGESCDEYTEYINISDEHDFK